MSTPRPPDALDEYGELSHTLSDAALALRALLSPTKEPLTPEQREQNLARAAALGGQLSLDDFIGLRFWKHRVDRRGSWEVQQSAVPDGTVRFTQSPNLRRCAMHWESADEWDGRGRQWVDGVELPTQLAPGVGEPLALGCNWIDDDRCGVPLLLSDSGLLYGGARKHALLLWDARTQAPRRLDPPPGVHWAWPPQVEIGPDGALWLRLDPGAPAQPIDDAA